MADPRLERFRQQMRQDDEKKNNTGGGGSGDNASYPYWNIPENATAVVRLLPDKDENNPWCFYAERQSIKLPFAGVVGGDFPTDKPVTVTVPCMDMFEKNTCPIIAETKPWWDDAAKKPLARLYYKKRSNIAQGFVVTSPFEEQNQPENPIRRFVMGSELLGKIKAGMADPDMEYMPTDYTHGCDFRIRKTIRKGEREFNNYSTSEWARRTRPLSEAELIAIEQFGLFNLTDFLGSRPDADGIAAIRALFHASLAGGPFDMVSFGKYPWKPYSGQGAAPTVTSTVASPASTSSDSDTDDVAEDQVSSVTAAYHQSDSKDEPQDIMAKLRAKAASRV